MKTTYHATSANGAPHQHRASKSTTPMTSPTMLVPSVGQPYPPRISPKLSPGASVSKQESIKASSPSYFGLLVEPISDSLKSGSVPHDNWSSPSSSIKSFAAAVPKQPLPLEVNPAYDAFRSQADANALRRSFALDSPILGDGMPLTTTKMSLPRTLQITSDPAPAALARPKPQTPARLPPQQEARETVSDSEANLSPCPGSCWAHTDDNKIPQSAEVIPAAGLAQSMDVDADANSLHDSAYVSSDSKRNSEVSLDPMLYPNMQRFESPSQLDASSEFKSAWLRRDQDWSKDNKSTRNSPWFPLPPGGRMSFPSALSTLPRSVAAARSETAPAKLDTSFDMMDPSRLKEIMDEAASDDSSSTPLLLLDVRVSAHFADSHIRGALNLCIPTTLLKRATFNLQKVQLAFGKPDEQDRFSAWRNARHLVVYDSNSYYMRDAVSAVNMLRKFTSEGYKGQACVLRGGVRAFGAAFPDLMESRTVPPSSSGPAPLTLDLSGKRRPPIAPIIGGVLLPSDSGNPSPFFSSIRQNVDLADGVGRMDVSLPPNVDLSALPAWLREASEPRDHGQRVSERFLQIELDEQARMKRAYTAFNISAQSTSSDKAGQVQLSGIEKGGKNRYKDILPFEHARVRLHGCAAGTCDYVNASHIRASHSFKRYIASQGPLPATFDDFWSMVWDQDVRVIVMLTAESEGGQIKCHPYWTSKDYGPIKLRVLSEKKVSLDVQKHRSDSAIPASGSWTSSASGPLSVPETGRRRATTLMSVDSTGNSSGGISATQALQLHGPPPIRDTSFVIIRKFALSHSSHPFSPIREVTQLHYASWPDFGAPAQPSDLLALVELANMTQRSASPLESRVALSKTSFSTAPSSEGNDAKAAPITSGSSGSSGSSTWTGGKLDSLFYPWHDEPESGTHSRPMLVHCSAGCGRTGTFCTIDSVIDMLKRERQRSARLANMAVARTGWQESGVAPDVRVGGEDVVMTDGEGNGADAALPDNGFASLGPADDLVARTVGDFRTQRLSMVQSLRQFVLCYETITEWVAKTQEHAGSGGDSRGLGRTRSESMRMTMG